MRLLSRLFGLRTSPAFPPVSADSPFYAIGDIHGSYPLLQDLLKQCDAGLLRVYVGDYVDRGDESAQVLRHVMADQNAVALIGNHEAMMLGFIDAPDKKGSRWLRYGGLQTLASFGVSGVTESASSAALQTARDALVAAMGEEMISWLRSLPTSYTNGNVAVVHAGADPREPMSLQSANTLMWGHPDFATVARTDGIWVLHGHTIVDDPYAADGRIAIDTGGYATGRLTAAHVSQSGVTFVTT
ncbi:serine/threonine protein phosphatase 1 [Cognatiyoonia koreensis]|uniref:Serine/threonine protein phosphatase 1 n=1 Tax=Cognatiyoonia koreensis TaxID=364200 RepID=A0A1I0RLC8_9RHOB|nr:metallophosphoesterase [Cognatiyoonia koreensis]SEW41939.1 serine/threonine protein phosphatase 1 [Cognatiyoonia koreensis]